MNAEITKEDNDLACCLYRQSAKVGFAQTIANHRVNCAAKTEAGKLADEFREKFHRPFTEQVTSGYVTDYEGSMIDNNSNRRRLAAYLNTCEDLQHIDD